MSDDEADPELLELLRETLGSSRKPKDEISSDTGCLKDAEYIYNNAIDVLIEMYATKAAAVSIYSSMRERGYSTQTWGEHELHPTSAQGFSDIDIVNFVFTMDLLNFSFWSELSEDERFQVEYQGRRWTGYKSLLACLRRALDENVPVTTPEFWVNQQCSNDVLQRVFRSATNEQMPLLDKRIAILRETGEVLQENFGDPELHLDEEHDALSGDAFAINQLVDPMAGVTLAQIPQSSEQDEFNQISDQHAMDTDTISQEVNALPQLPDSHPEREAEPQASTTTSSEIKAPSGPDLSVVRLIEKADHSAGKLVNLLVKYFPSFRDEARFDGRKVRLFKRAQIFVADLWAAFNGSSHGAFDDIEHLTMFADYRVPQMLHSLGVLVYSPPLNHAVRSLRHIEPGHSWEVQLRGCSIWAVELIRREILRLHPEATEVNAVLIDFFLYDLAKEKEGSGRLSESVASFV